MELHRKVHRANVKPGRFDSIQTSHFLSTIDICVDFVPCEVWHISQCQLLIPESQYLRLHVQLWLDFLDFRWHLYWVGNAFVHKLFRRTPFLWQIQ